MDAAQLSSIALFADLDEVALQQIAQGTEQIEVPLGTVLAKQGDYAYRFFGILDGLAAVTKDGKMLATLGPGDIFGEIGALSKEKRTANVVAITPMRLAAMMVWDFEKLNEEYPTVAAQVQRSIEERLSQD